MRMLPRFERGVCRPHVTLCVCTCVYSIFERVCVNVILCVRACMCTYKYANALVFACTYGVYILCVYACVCTCFPGEHSHAHWVVLIPLIGLPLIHFLGGGADQTPPPPPLVFSSSGVAVTSESVLMGNL